MNIDDNALEITRTLRPHDPGSWNANIFYVRAALARERDAALEGAQDVIATQGRDHKQPCGLGSLCPWCEIERLKERLKSCEEERERGGTIATELARDLMSAQRGLDQWRQKYFNLEHEMYGDPGHGMGLVYDLNGKIDQLAAELAELKAVRS